MSEIRSQATPARDELAALILAEPNGWRLNRDNLAAQILAAGWVKPRTVNSATELDALPVGSVILVDAGRYGASAWQKHTNGRWCEASHVEESMTSTELRAGNLPTTVLFTPGDAG